jgi:glycosyltransferase involved in cell wall biosynthesis
MRILIANTGHPAHIKGGAEAAALDLAKGLAGRGHEVTLVVHHGGRDREGWRDGDVAVRALPNRNLYFGFDGAPHAGPARLLWHVLDSANPLMARAFGQVLDEVRPDLVNTHALAGLSPLIWREASRRQIPVVHYLHEYGLLCPRGSGFRDGALCRRPCLPCAALGVPRKALTRHVAAVIGVSRYTLDRHLAWGLFREARTAVIPNVFTDLPLPVLRARRNGPLRVGYFGRLIPDKGAHRLVEAFQAIPPSLATLTLAGTGDAPYVESLKAGAPPGVTFLGWSSPASFFAQIDLLAVPSVWPDPQPRVVFEAYAHGVPVLGTRAGGIPEQIEEERTGWLVEAGSSEALAREIGAIAAEALEARLPAGALEERLSRLRPERVLPAYERLFAEVLAPARAPVSQTSPALL